MSNQRILFAKELELARVRKIGDVDRAMKLEIADIDIDVARNIARQALDLDLVHHLAQNAARALHAYGNASQLHRHRDTHGLVHRNTLQIDVQQLALDGLVLPVDDHGLGNARTLDRQIEDRVVTGIRVQNLGNNLGINR